MGIDLQTFLNWAEDRFNGEVIVRGNEILINSVFTEDRKFKMWCSPSGGKHNREEGCYRCWKTDNRGTLVGLVMRTDGCSYQEAKDTLDGGVSSLGQLEEKLHKFFADKEVTPRPPNNINLPPEASLITDLPAYQNRNVVNYLTQRKIKCDGLYYCVYGEYRERVVIPYYDKDGKLIYFNSRHIGKSTFRYKGPPKTCGVGKGDVLFASCWPDAGSKVYLTEGEFDAMTLDVCGLYGVACGGKFLGDKQLDMLRPYKVCLALDNDETPEASASPGLLGMLEMGEKLLSVFFQVTFVRPPPGFKDWNKMLVIFNENIISQYINKCEKPLDILTLEQIKCMTY